MDVFAWNAYEALGVHPKFICHRLNVNPKAPPKKQLPRRSPKEHAEVVKYEVHKLIQAGAIKEVFYLEWVANTMVVRKKLGKWRVYMDFTDLNKACKFNNYNILKFLDDMFFNKSLKALITMI